MGVKQGVLCNDQRCADGKLLIFGSKIYFAFVKVLSCTAQSSCRILGIKFEKFGRLFLVLSGTSHASGSAYQTFQFPR